MGTDERKNKDNMRKAEGLWEGWPGVAGDPVCDPPVESLGGQAQGGRLAKVLFSFQVARSWLPQVTPKPTPPGTLPPLSSRFLLR